jgi:hypothetical protein
MLIYDFRFWIFDFGFMILDTSTSSVQVYDLRERRVFKDATVIARISSVSFVSGETLSGGA